MKGKLLIAKSKRGREGGRNLLYPKDLKETLEAQKGLFAKGYLKKSFTLHPLFLKALSIIFESFVNFDLSSFVHFHDENIFK